MSKSLLFLIALLLSAKITLGQRMCAVDVTDSTFRKYERFVSENVVYPPDATSKGIEGIVHVGIKLNSNQQVIPESVSIVSGLTQSCDEEAMRVVRAYRGRFKLTGGQGDTTKRCVVPLHFFIEGILDPVYCEHTFKPFKAVVKPKAAKTIYPNWSIYQNTAMDIPIKNVLPGDTVTVSGWGAWSFYIANEFTTGFISYNALERSAIVDSLITVIEKKSPTEKTPPPRQVNTLTIVSYDTAKIYNSPTARFSVTASKNSIKVGECVKVSISFDVDVSNRLPVQFWNLAEQHARINNQLIFPGFIHVRDQITEVMGIRKSNANSTFTEYAIIRQNYCPTTAKPLVIPPLKIKMIVAPTGQKHKSSLVTFQSAPLKVGVTASLPGISTSLTSPFKIIGDAKLKDAVSKRSVLVGEHFQYSVTVAGSSSIILLEPPQLDIPGLNIQLSDIVTKDSIGENIMITRTFIYDCIAEKEGSYDFKNQVQLQVYDASGTSQGFTSSETVEAKGLQSPADELNPNLFFSKSLLIAIDVSQSMMIEDYLPTRLEAIKDGLRKFAKKHDLCKIGIIVFGGNANHLSLPDGDLCYTVKSIDSISHNASVGTAIGDAIWFGCISLKTGTPGKLIIIGDGDNTAGYLVPAYAAQVAKSKGTKIFAIGVGNHGEVPFGRDASNRPLLISNTFSDKDLRMLSRVTGAEYQWAKNSDEIAKAIETFFFER